MIGHDDLRYAPLTAHESAHIDQMHALATLGAKAAAQGDYDTAADALDQSAATESRMATSRERTWARHIATIIEVAQ